ncbi:VCBS repeat-containing protein [Nonomuraea sp. MG754425]|uniref:FG-GAP repeat domain-containing protein n=1 Tax=Nonomuraea sp. MG754425 TaxID=2570319 RepID=UPI001F2175CF|nr:VCBS repeat-containing protein [Nonomuraea sp. MG754425]MCF6469299.1 VCBS repeat-containing protein [Nonomuraea sp. MG754425]
MVRVPTFDREVVADGLTDGYWIQAVDLDGSGRPGLLTSGLAEGVVRWYANPGWQEHVITRLRQPVAFDAADLTGDGRLDLVVCHDYGESMYAHKPDDGTISWLRNPGGRLDRPWESRRIGTLVSAHRLRVGRFTADRPQLLALPVVGDAGGREGLDQPARVTVFDVPDDVLAAGGWDVAAVDAGSFTVLHDYTPLGADPTGTERLVVASREGLSEYGWDAGRHEWRTRRIGAGEHAQRPATGFAGSSSVALGTLNDGTRYAATLEPFHGNTVSVYTDHGGAGLWRRAVLDVFGDPNEAGEGPGHHVVAADFDGDGEDEFLVALRGPMPWQGVFYYKAVDAAEGLWTRERVSEDSAARIAVADFGGDGRLGFATIGYYTPGYFLADDPVVVVHRNRG